MRIRRTLREVRGLPPSEHTEAARFMRIVRLHEPQYPSLLYLHAIPNGGWRRKAVAAKLKAEGVRRGVLDYCWPVRMPVPGDDGALYSGLYIELKTVSEHSRPTKEQKEFAAFVRGQGFKAVFARSWEEAWREVCEYAGIPYRVA